MKPEFIDDIGESYIHDSRTGNITFSDGVKYTLDESLTLARQGISGRDLKMIHAVKRAFEGEIMRPVEKEKCQACRGKGILYCYKYDTKTECSRCNGTGYITIQ